MHAQVIQLAHSTWQVLRSAPVHLSLGHLDDQQFSDRMMSFSANTKGNLEATQGSVYFSDYNTHWMQGSSKPEVSPSSSMEENEQLPTVILGSWKPRREVSIPAEASSVNYLILARESNPVQLKPEVIKYTKAKDSQAETQMCCSS
jgi:hypothetical protein